MLKLATRIIYVTSDEVRAFALNWLDSGFMVSEAYNPVTFEFDTLGNLVHTIAINDWTNAMGVDKEAVNALCDNARQYLRERRNG